MIRTPVSSVVTLTCADLDAVEALRERNTETLGFLAKGVLSHYLASGGGLGTKAPDGRLVAYQLFALHRRHIRIIHLCVAAEARGCGYAKALVDRLTDIARQRDIGVVKLNCRRDYPAHSLWPKLGFVPLDEKPAKTPGRRLTQWYLAIEGHGDRDLFHVAASDEKVNAVIDAHVFFHLHDPDGESGMVSKGLQADFLDDLLQLYITDEMFVEIDRDQSATRREASRRHAHSFPKVPHNHDKVSGFSSVLRQILPTATHAQKSDISQLAKTAASDVRIFLTMDARLLGAADRIQRAVGVRVLTPTKLIVQLDEFTDPTSYASTPLSGSNLTWRKLDHDALARLPIDRFLAPSEKKHCFERPLNESLSYPQIWQTCGLMLDDDLVAIRALRIEPQIDRITVKLCRVSRCPEHELFTQFAIASILHEAVHIGCGEIRLLPHSTAPDAADDLQSFDFTITEGGFVRYCLPKIMSFAQLQSRLHDVSYGKATLHELEKMCSPVVLKDSALNCFMIPIKSAYAKVLFDTDLARTDMFPVDSSVLLRWKKVYYRSQSHHRMLRAPARLLWYESGTKSGTSGYVVAVSHLDAVTNGPPKEMFREHRRSGVLAWSHIYEMCHGNEVQDIMVLRFSHTFLFNHPVSLAELRSLCAIHDAPPVVQSPSRVPPALFFDIFRLGFERRSPS